MPQAPQTPDSFKWMPVLFFYYDDIEKLARYSQYSYILFISFSPKIVLILKKKYWNNVCALLKFHYTSHISIQPGASII